MLSPSLASDKWKTLIFADDFSFQRLWALNFAHRTFSMLSRSLITYFGVTYWLISGATLNTFLFWEACTHFDLKSKRLKLVSSAWRHLKALLKLFTVVHEWSTTSCSSENKFNLSTNFVIKWMLTHKWQIFSFTFFFRGPSSPLPLSQTQILAYRQKSQLWA